ncbi:DMT family transporter [Clostridium oceanicum]|uniref:DMT family transporter n=1 Tax=Clostridium oceanicum TaxID=1543 RepID=A0ABN1JSE6_9CLOT
MLGIIYSIIAGISMTLQGVFNTRLSDKIGLWETNCLVQGIGFILTLIAVFTIGSGNIKNIKSANKMYLLGGVLGAIIIYTVMRGIKSLGATCAIGIILISQLSSAGLVDCLGLFNCEPIKFGFTKIAGIIIMIVGIIIFKIR